MQQFDPNFTKQLPPSPVLLVCITNKQNHIITHDIYFKYFSKYGEVQRILIFERSIQWKTFVEMDSFESANLAKEALNNTYIFDDNTRMNVYNSQLQRIVFQENNSGGVDYTILKKKIEEKKQIKKCLAISGQSFSYDQDFDINQCHLDDYSQSSQDPSQSKAIMHQIEGLKMNCQYQSLQNVANSSGSELTQTNLQNIQFITELYQNKQGHSPTELPSRKVSLFSQMNCKGINKTQSDMLPYQNDNFSKGQAQIFNSLNINQKEQDNNWITFNEQLLLKNYAQQDNLQQGSNSISKTLSGVNSGTCDNKDELDLLKKIAQNQTNYNNNQDLDFDIENLNVIDSEYNLDKNNNQNNNEIEEEIHQEKGQNSDSSLDESTFKHAFSNQFPNNIQNNSIAQNLNSYNFQINNLTLSQLNSKEDKKTAVINLIENETQHNIEQKTDQSIFQIDKLIDEKKHKQKKMLAISLESKPFNYNEQINEDSQQFAAKPKEPLVHSADLYENITEDLDLANYVNPLFLKATRKSKVIYARWFEKDQVNLNMLYNIFSTFGNIEKMIYIKDKSSALVEYQKIENAQIAKEYLNDQKFLGQTIKIFYSNYEKVFIKDTKNEKPLLSNNQEEYFIGYPQTYRFQNDKQFQINPISETLHVSNLKKEACHIEIFNKYFPKILINLQKYKFIMHQNNKNMCLLKFENKEQALEALAYMHNTEIFGRKIQISFSKIKLQSNLDQEVDYLNEQSFA